MAKLTALQKAYADVILNMSKEAAARVMSSERKSARYQHELKVAKEEGLRMLLRLKGMMDSQVSEAESALFYQQKKNDELEAQLQEAEDIVSELRQELRDVHAELDRVKNENLRQLNAPDYTYSREIPTENEIYTYQSNKFLLPNDSSVGLDVPHLNMRNECQRCYNKIVCTCSVYVENRDLPSIILRGKEPGLYRNGCTHRIHACERNLLDRDLSRSVRADIVKDKKNGGEQDESKDTSVAPDSGDKTPTELEKKLLADIKLGSFEPFLKKRKRATRRRRTMVPLDGKQSYQLPENSAASNPISVENNADSDKNPSKTGPRLAPGKAEPLTPPRHAKAFDKEKNLVEIFASKTISKDEGVKGNMMLLREATGFSDSLCSPDYKTDVEEVDASPHLLESAKGVSSQPVRERVIKYTFQRKRKRQALSGSEVNGFLETKKNMEDEENGDEKLEQTNSSLLMDSSRESRRLAQVARQLMALSEKKWWD